MVADPAPAGSSTRPRGLVAAVVVAAGVSFLTLLASVAAIPAVLVSRDRGAPAIARLWARAALAWAGVRVTVDDRSGGGWAPPCVVMANHTSHFDVVALYAVLPLAVRFVAKRELQFVPVFGQVLALGAAIMIDRGDKGRAIASIARAGRAIRRGASVVLFPEGTRTPPGRLGPLKKGPFHLAAAARVPILPVGIVGTGAVLLPGDWRIQRGVVEVRIGAPIIPPARAVGAVETEAEEASVRAELMGVVAEALCVLGELEAQSA